MGREAVFSSSLGVYGPMTFLPQSGFLAARVLRTSLAALAVAMLAGCQGIDMSSPNLRVIDASPDAGALDAYQNNTGFAYNLGLGTVTSYVPMTPGTYTLTAEKSGTRQALAASTVALLAGRQYTAVISNVAAGLQQTVLLDQNTPAPAGQTAIRLVQDATRSGAVDVYLVPKSGHLAASSPLAINLVFGANSGYLLVPAGTYAIDVVPVGTTLASNTVTLLSGAQTDFASGSVHTVVLMDQETLTKHPAPLTAGVQALVATDVEGQS
jgi:hypothetical protein